MAKKPGKIDAAKKPGKIDAAKKPGKIDAAGILKTLGEIRKSLPRPTNFVPPPSRHDGKLDMQGGSMEDFEMQAVADSLESMASELSQAIDEAHLKLFNQALDVYYAAVDLTKDGENPEVVPHVQAMEEAYEKSYGRKIPPREKRDEALKDFRRTKR